MLVSRRRAIGGAAFLLGTRGGALAAAGAAGAAAPSWKLLAEEVKGELAWAWDNYRQHAWGKDEIKPISGGSSTFPLKGHHLGLTLIEALDTLWVMGLDSRFQDGVDWARHNLDFAVDGEVSVFETSIRLVGGLLSAHHACGEPFLLAKAAELADRLLPAFDTPTGMPCRLVNLKTRAGTPGERHQSRGHRDLPGRMGTLTRLTGDGRYAAAAKRAMRALFDAARSCDLVATQIDVLTGEWRRGGPRSDPIATASSILCGMAGSCSATPIAGGCTTSARAPSSNTSSVARRRLVVRRRRFETGGVVSTEQDELASFYGGLLAQGGAREERARAYTRELGEGAGEL